MHRTDHAALASRTSTDAPLGDSRLPIRDSAGTDKSAPEKTGEGGYHPGLSASELVAKIRGLLATERRAECLLCRYLGDLADRVETSQDAEFGVYADELEAARHFFGLRPRDTRERVRVGRALRSLPEIELAFFEGALCYSRVREITR